MSSAYILDSLGILLCIVPPEGRGRSQVTCSALVPRAPCLRASSGTAGFCYFRCTLVYYNHLRLPLNVL